MKYDTKTYFLWRDLYYKFDRCKWKAEATTTTANDQLRHNCIAIKIGTHCKTWADRYTHESISQNTISLPIDYYSRNLMLTFCSISMPSKAWKINFTHLFIIPKVPFQTLRKKSTRPHLNRLPPLFARLCYSSTNIKSLYSRPRKRFTYFF